MQNEPAFDKIKVARKLLREARSAALATLTPGGAPYCSLVNVATLADGAPVLLISRLAVHTQNILGDGRASLLLSTPTQGDPLDAPRLSVLGRAVQTNDPEAGRRYLDRHPDAQMFVDFPDFAFYRLEAYSAHLIAGFGRIVDLSGEELLLDLRGAEPLLASEPDVLAHMNQDHSEALRLYATKLLGAPDDDWRCVGCDPEGLELQKGFRALRLTFPRRADSPAVLRQLLKQLAEEARSP